MITYVIFNFLHTLKFIRFKLYNNTISTRDYLLNLGYIYIF